MSKFEFPLGYYSVTVDGKTPNPILYANIQKAIFARGGAWLAGSKKVQHLEDNDLYIKLCHANDAEICRNKPNPYDTIKPAIDLVKVLFKVGDQLKFKGRIHTIKNEPILNGDDIDIPLNSGFVIRLNTTDVDLIPATKSEKTYLEIHKESGLKVGDKVKIVRKVPNFDKGWPNVWDPDMDQYIGKEFIIDEDINSDGFSLKGISYIFPAYALEKVEDSFGYSITTEHGSSYWRIQNHRGLPIYMEMPRLSDMFPDHKKSQEQKDIAPKKLKLRNLKIKQVPFKGLDIAKKKPNVLQDKLSKKLSQKEKENDKNRTASKW